MERDLTCRVKWFHCFRQGWQIAVSREENFQRAEVAIWHSSSVASLLYYEPRTANYLEALVEKALAQLAPVG